MGLFSWLKKTGTKASTDTGNTENKTVNNTNASSKTTFESNLVEQKKNQLTRLVSELNIKIENFDLDIHASKVKVYGQVHSDADKDMILSTLHKADSVDEVDSRISVLTPSVQTYIVKKGDSLSAIAEAYYGDPMQYKKIFAANTNILDDPNKIYPGQKLTIPNV